MQPTLLSQLSMQPLGVGPMAFVLAMLPDLSLDNAGSIRSAGNSGLQPNLPPTPALVLDRFPAP